MNRKDFRPENNSYSMNERDRQKIRDNYKPHQQKAVGDRDHVIGVFINGNGSSKTSNNSLHTDGKKLYSYNTVIATKQSDGSINVNNTKYSQTTTIQQNELIDALQKRGEKYSVTGGKPYNYGGEDFDNTDKLRKHNYNVKEMHEYDKQIASEKKASKEYSKLAKENPEDKKKLKEISREEKQHSKELKKLEKDDNRYIKREELTKSERRQYDKGTLDTSSKLDK